MEPQLAAIAVRQGGVFTRGDAIAVGYSPGEIRARIRSGRWTVQRRGVYADSAGDGAVARLAAVLCGLPESAALSHRSAAALLALPLVGLRPGPIEVTVPGAAGRTRRGVAVHGRALPPDHVQLVGSLRVTTAARTAVDLARSLPYPAAVCVVDSALRTPGCDPDVLARLLAGDTGPGSARARRVVAFADAGAESAGESLSRVRIASNGLPAPQLQPWLGDPGEAVGRVDFFWPEHRTVGEFDGRGKYDRVEVLWAEKLREDRLRAAGFQICRWTWPDVVGDFAPVAARLRAAFARGGRQVDH